MTHIWVIALALTANVNQTEGQLNGLQWLKVLMTACIDSDDYAELAEYWSIQSQLLSSGFQIWWRWTMWTSVGVVNLNSKTEFIQLYIGVVGKGMPWTICNTDWRLNGIDCEFRQILWRGKKRYISWSKQLPSSPVPPQCLPVLPIHLSLFTRTSTSTIACSPKAVAFTNSAESLTSWWCGPGTNLSVHYS